MSSGLRLSSSGSALQRREISRMTAKVSAVVFLLRSLSRRSSSAWMTACVIVSPVSLATSFANCWAWGFLMVKAIDALAVRHLWTRCLVAQRLFAYRKYNGARLAVTRAETATRAPIRPAVWILRKDATADDDSGVLQMWPDPQGPLRVTRFVPLWSFRNAGVVHLVHRQILRISLDGNITPSAGYPRYAYQSRHVIHIVPLVKVLLFLGGDVQPHGEDKIRILCRPGAVREDLPVGTTCRVAEERKHFLRPLRGHFPHLAKRVALQHFGIAQIVERQVLGLAFDRLIAAPT